MKLSSATIPKIKFISLDLQTKRIFFYSFYFTNYSVMAKIYWLYALLHFITSHSCSNMRLN